MNRQEGYCWVKRRGEWEVAEWQPSWRVWCICGTDVDEKESSFEEINEQRLEPHTT